MTITTINASEEHCLYIGQVYEEYNVRLRDYFLAQLGNTREADNCVQETIRLFFFFMEDRCWETDAEYIPVYVMRIAGFLCSRKLAERSGRRKDSLISHKTSVLFDKIRTEVAQTIKGRAEFWQLFLRIRGNNRQSRVKQLTSLRDVPVASA
jgi:hypothetical protein